jgi:3-oxochol-4-en-24-oyl-CoA dehydrogenase
VRLDRAVADLLAGPELSEEAVARALAVAQLAVAGIAVGGARWALDAAVSYAASRTQFGQPIGSFQAVKHLCAEMLVSLEAAKALALNAALVMAEESRPDTWRRDLDAAFLCATEEFVAVAKGSTHVHGGVGVTWEFGLHRYLKRALSLDSLVEPVSLVRDRLRMGLRASQA